VTETELARRIADYWKDLGYTVEVEVRMVAETLPSGATWRYPAVRSDLRHGLPYGYRGELAKKDPAQGGASEVVAFGPVG
jgi:hypothetical protein